MLPSWKMRYNLNKEKELRDYMKRYIVLILSILVSGMILADDMKDVERETVVYTFFINKIPHQTNIPMIGFINLAEGDQSTIQVGFINTIGRNLDGIQIGFVNVTGGSLNGIQTGFVNTAGADVTGPQIGFVNICGNSMTGVQTGFVNVSGNMMEGPQIGFVNMTENDIEGIQVGFVNKSKSLDGLQIGFVNVTDTLKSGIPVGFISYVKHGGYKAVEVSASNEYPLNISFKTGVKQLYSSVMLSHNPDYDREYSIAAGLGTIIPAGRSWAFNPELISRSLVKNKNYYQSLRFAPNVILWYNGPINLITGFTVNLDSGNKIENFYDPAYSLFEYELNHKNRLTIGMQIGLRYTIGSYGIKN